ncbi:prephenate dehydrogenase/prephenate dehydrogenase (NADP+) [Acididesulfobacillus acetoxydans]|uniref:Prephenate dehydrogenase n=1 Tax=Acididesulfobacillus acetoxydans TaxID=1561005 RepID=A0A8S0X5Y1_9FIRM|nr:prephenate dehydrogenase/arogenate dehydrogenase family protein [Acididesulfobacillus acetoxydans]CAA7602040.1 prephenate dehydrogenase/prephenate dehydrogenase (NADP+) [Acididesulfobacillus acetoxydans]CEJ08117.1 Prephenate dehydrogenase [Acididesulfobacillus acetoxydans]
MSVVERKRLSPGWLGESSPLACVVGLGLIGGSWAGALHTRGWRVLAVDHSPDSLERAREMGWIDEGYLSMPEYFDFDLIVLALPLPLLLPGLMGLTGLSGKIRPGAIITDVGSLKAEICAEMPELLGKDVWFIGGHPMTGSEKSGIQAATPDLFKGYPYVLTPEGCREDALLSLTALLEDMGAHVVLRGRERHDEEVAMVSHVPHFLAVALALAAQDISREGDSALELAGRSFREATRVAESSPEMWREIALKNRAAILAGLECWQKRLDELKDCLLSRDGEGIAGSFRAAARVRRTMRWED